MSVAGLRCMISLFAHYCLFCHIRGQWHLPMTPLQRLYRMGKAELRLSVTVYQDHFTRGVEILLLSTRYYPSPYPVTNRIMTVQPTMSPYMSPVSAYQVDPQDPEIHFNFNFKFTFCFSSHLMSIYVMYTGMWVMLYFCERVWVGRAGIVDVREGATPHYPKKIIQSLFFL